MAMNRDMMAKIGQMAQQLQKAQADLAEKSAEGTSGGGAVHVGGDRTGPVGRTDRAGDIARSRRIFRRHHRDSFFCRPGARRIQLINVGFQLVIGHRYRG